MSSDERTFGANSHAMEDQAALEIVSRAIKMAPGRAPYRWCSARRSSRGCIHTCRPGRSRVPHSVGGRPVGRTQPPSNRPHSGRCLLHRRHGHHSQQHRSLWARKKGQGGGEREQRLIEPVVAGNKGHTWPPR